MCMGKTSIELLCGWGGGSFGRSFSRLSSSRCPRCFGRSLSSLFWSLVLPSVFKPSRRSPSVVVVLVLNVASSTTNAVIMCASMQASKAPLQIEIAAHPPEPITKVKECSNMLLLLLLHYRPPTWNCGDLPRSTFSDPTQHYDADILEPIRPKRKKYSTSPPIRSKNDPYY
jgi:hypothetical protein